MRLHGGAETGDQRMFLYQRDPTPFRKYSDGITPSVYLIHVHSRIFNMERESQHRQNGNALQLTTFSLAIPIPRIFFFDCTVAKANGNYPTGS